MGEGLSDKFHLIEDEKHSMFTIMKTKYLKKLKDDQLEDLKECWNSKIEVQYEKPHARN